MNGYVAKRRGRFYAVIYEGLDPVTGRERRRWHPAGTDRAEAERLAARLAAEETGPSRRRAVADLRRLPHRPMAAGQEAAPRHQHLPRLRAQRAAPRPAGARTDRAAPAAPPAHRGALRPRSSPPPPSRPALAPKTVYEIHLIIRGCARRRRSARAASPATSPSSPAPQAEAIPQRPKPSRWTDDELRQFLRTAAGHRLFPLLWLTAMTGMRRNEVLGLKWDDIDFNKQPARTSTAGSSPSATSSTRPAARPRPPVAPSTSTHTTLAVLAGWRAYQAAEFAAVGIDNASGGCSPTATATRSTPRRLRRRSSGSPAAPASPSSASTISATPTAACSSRKACRSRSSASGSATPTSPSPSQTYQHVLPGMQADAARVYRTARRARSTGRREPGGTPGEHPEEDRLNPVERPHNDEGPGR